ncbi:MAG: ABC transporter substrate-binding protein, partial [Chloroflexi bacterium]|nr:ABC transporter substrate-binding protein [Chloroflexota bacterium]
AKWATKIADATNHSWPRRAIGMNGEVVVKAKPVRLLTLSLGYDEITFALVEPKRVIAVGAVSADSHYSNVAEIVKGIPNRVKREAEAIIATGSDLVVADEFTKPELVQQLTKAGLTVVQSDISSSVEAYADNIRFLAYIYGEEERGEKLVREVRARLDRVAAIIGKKQTSERKHVLYLMSGGYVPGSDTSIDGIIRLAGGVNAAAEAGLKGFKQIGIESIVQMRPDMLIIQDEDAAKVKQDILGNSALSEVPAIKNNQVFTINFRYIDTLSHWNVRGVEELARLLYPKDFAGMEFPDFKYQW